MKILILCLLIIGPGWSSSQAAHQDAKRDSAKQTTEADGHPVPPPPGLVVRGPADGGDTQTHTNRNASQPDKSAVPRRYSAEWVSALISGANLLVTLAYVIITGFMWWTIRRQVKEARDSSAESSRIATATLAVLEQQSESMRFQAGALKDSADAGLLHAKALINTERPWIMVSAERSEMCADWFEVSVKNVGRTPAILLGCSQNFAFGGHTGSIPRDPQYAEMFEYDPPLIMLPDDKHQICLITEVMLYRAIDAHKADGGSGLDFVYPYGYVAYRDVLDSPTAMRHETRWCYWLGFKSGDKPATIHSIGIGKYAGHT
jgi:hypothetical protein